MPECLNASVCLFLLCLPGCTCLRVSVCVSVCLSVHLSVCSHVCLNGLTTDAQTNTYDVRYRDAEVQFDRPVSATKEMLRVQHREAEQRRQLQNNAWTELFGLLEESAAGAMHLMNHASDHALLGEIQGAETERRTAIEYYEDGARYAAYYCRMILTALALRQMRVRCDI